ncbi:hypothetical protein D5086_032785 [Populus alba]|uniref:Uncharacterized protein n=1 Tax=Populus alba TaxID=43335 RepID=A0ACC4AEZ3_POPAL
MTLSTAEEEEKSQIPRSRSGLVCSVIGLVSGALCIGSIPLITSFIMTSFFTVGEQSCSDTGLRSDVSCTSSIPPLMKSFAPCMFSSDNSFSLLCHFYMCPFIVLFLCIS